jgi:phosphoribosylformylglycinamidine synthase
MHWDIAIHPLAAELDGEARRVLAELTERGVSLPGPLQTARVYLLGLPSPREQVDRITRQLLCDAAVEMYELLTPEEAARLLPPNTVTVLLKPGVMDPAAETVQQVLKDEGQAASVRTGRRYFFPTTMPAAEVKKLAEELLANDAIEQVVLGPLPPTAWAPVGSEYIFRKVTVPLLSMKDEELVKLSREGQLALNLAEMQTVQQHFHDLGRDPTDAELETIAQTWSEHCSHKTLKGRIRYEGPQGTVEYQNMLKETIFHATQEIRKRLGENDWCVSVFADNAGVVRFDPNFHVCFKVETHNHPSAIEPYGGANTGLGGVIRDVLGTGLGGKPICNTDVFCFAPPEYPREQLPPGVLPPKRVMRGVVAGVRDYGNRMGIPTVNGAICFDERYLGNPLVYCGTVGLIPKGMETKEAKVGDLIVAVGGRTGRDGIHGATFSSIELSQESEKVSGGAVQIGNAITQKKMLDVILQARDRGLYHAITDCGAGGFSSAVGEMGADLGAEVHLERALLKYQGLSYTEIWISEAQERMVLAVPPEKWPELQALCASEDVEATAIGTFVETGRLQLFYQGNEVANLDMHFLHDGRPPTVRQAVWKPAPAPTPSTQPSEPTVYTETLLRILASPNVRSKEAVIRVYDHEVQGGTVIKPLVGATNDGPGDAAVITPIPGGKRGLAIGCGINPRYGDLDPYWMAASAIDEAVRNVVAVGADPDRTAILDNFCWGNTDRPEVLGSLVRAAEACRDVALAYNTPFISGKDSLKNEFHAGDWHIVIPPTLLISAMGQVPDIARCVTMDLKKPGNKLYLLGVTKEELGGSHYHLVTGQQGGQPPTVDMAIAPRLFRTLHQAIRYGYVVACHDLSEGGLAVALAEMCFAGGLGAVADCSLILDNSDKTLSPAALLFSESNTRFLLEVPFEWERVMRNLFDGLPLVKLGQVADQPRLSIFGSSHGGLLIDAALPDLKAAWQTPLGV